MHPNRIQRLPKELAEKIAAGEVIERPGSVVKELIENALDAGATHITLELEEGGRRKIVVQDNGHGIAAEDLPLALERHATSKVTQLEDLWNLSTLGFRGEALPSIATVSRFTIESKAEGHRGRKLYLEGGTVRKDEPLSAPHVLSVRNGTRITVEDLFYNVPARLKFLKVKSSEGSFIRELLERLALTRPETGFALLTDGRRSIELPARQSVEERVASVLGCEPTALETFHGAFEDIQVEGWLDRNSRAPTSRYVYLSVNGRAVRDKLLQQAVLVALRPRMMEGEFPKVFVDVRVNPVDVDVNVHPAKTEVRFRRSRDVFQVVHGALDRLAVRPTQAFYAAPLSTMLSAPALRAAEPELSLALDTGVSYKTKAFEPAPELRTPAPTGMISPTAPTAAFTKLHYIGQLKNTYLLFQDTDGLVLVDQHAAHERIRYEAVKQAFFEEGLQPQPLLMGITVKCKAEEVQAALENTALFEKLGFQLEAFGENCLILRTSPRDLNPQQVSELFRSLLEELQEAEAEQILTKDPTRLSPKLERMLATMACHSSIRAGQALSPREATALLEEMEHTPSSLNCPHGRPASLHLSFSQIEGLFGRA